MDKENTVKTQAGKRGIRMTIKEIIDGLKFTVDMFFLDPSTGETYTEPRNDMDKTTIDACRGAIELLEQIRWIPVSERLPEEDGCYLVTTTGTNNDIIDIAYYTDGIWHKASRIKAWQPLPESYKAESEE